MSAARKRLTLDLQRFIRPADRPAAEHIAPAAFSKGRLRVTHRHIARVHLRDQALRLFGLTGARHADLAR